MAEETTDPRVVEVKRQIDAIFGDVTEAAEDTLEMLTEIGEHGQDSINAVKSDLTRDDDD